MAVIEPVYPDGTPYATIPLGTNMVSVSSSSALSSALSSASAGDKIVLANGTYSGSFSISGKNGSSSAGISVEAANVGGAVFSSSSTFNVNNSSWITLKGLSFPFERDSGNVTQFRGSSHHCRITRCLFGPTSVGSPGSNKSPFIYMGDTTNHIRIDHNELRNKANPGNAILGDGDFDTYNPVRWIRIDHNLIRNIEPEVDNEKEPIRLGVSTMSKKLSNSVIERNVFLDCICEPEVVSVKACAVRVSGNTVLRSIGGLVIRHGTNSILTDNYIVDRVDTYGSTIGSGGIRFYDADHVVSYNYVEGVYGGNFQGPLMLDSGDAEGSSTNLSAHWRVIGAQVERNVLYDNPEGIRFGHNYSQTPRDCTVRDNLVVKADSGAETTQRIAPSNTVVSNNQYYATTTAAGMTQGADTIWRKPGYGPRVSYLTGSDVGPSADLDDLDGTGAEVGGGTAPVAVPADVLGIGDEAGQSHFRLQYAVDGSGSTSSASLAEIAAGLDVDPYFTVVRKPLPIPGTDPVEYYDDQFYPTAVQFRVRADAATTGDSSFPRSELRETRADGSDMAFDAMVGEHVLRTKVRITHLPAGDPEVVVAQLHDGTNSERVSVRTQYTSSQTKLLVRVNGAQADPRLSESYAVGAEFAVEIRIREGGLVEVYYGGSSSPLVTGQLVSTGAPTWYWRLGAFAQFDESSVSASEYVAVEHRDLAVSHTGARVDAGADASAVVGLPFTRAAQELGLTGITSRRWTIVARPTPPTDPGPGDPDPDPGDLTIAAVRHGWGTPLPSSDEFNYKGVPDPSKWKLPGSDWAGHNGNGRRRPERQTVDGSKLVMTGLANGDSGWMQHRLEWEYGRIEVRMRSNANGSSNGNDYHPVLLIWPESNSRKSDGEYDLCENGRPGDTKAQAFMHFPGDGDQQRHFEKSGVDHTKFHNWALERTSSGLKGYLDGVEWFSTSGGASGDRRNIQAMGLGHFCPQLDNFDGTNQTPATMEIEWVRLYAP